MTNALEAQSLPENILHAVKVLCARSPAIEVGPSIKLLRERVKLTQREVGQRFSRRHSAVANWEANTKQPPALMTAGLLELFQIPREVWVNGETDLDLAPVEYMRRGSLAVEYEFFQKTRGQVLQAVKLRAEGGSDNAAKLYKEWMLENAAAVAASESKPKSVGDGQTKAVSDSWVKRALKQAKEGITTTTSSNLAIDDKSAVDATDVTPENVD